MMGLSGGKRILTNIFYAFMLKCALCWKFLTISKLDCLLSQWESILIKSLSNYWYIWYIFSMLLITNEAIIIALVWLK